MRSSPTVAWISRVRKPQVFPGFSQKLFRLRDFLRGTKWVGPVVSSKLYDFSRPRLPPVRKQEPIFRQTRGNLTGEQTPLKFIAISCLFSRYNFTFFIVSAVLKEDRPRLISFALAFRDIITVDGFA